MSIFEWSQDHYEEMIVVGLIVFFLTGVGILADNTNKRNHQKYVLCIESGQQWIKGDCVK